MRAARVWVGTRGGGLDRVVGSAREPATDPLREHLRSANGLPNDTVYGIRSDAQGALWVSTNYGLARLDPETRTAARVSSRDGLQGEEFGFGAHYANARGELFFGGTNGFNAFDPARLQFNTTPPPAGAHVAVGSQRRARSSEPPRSSMRSLHLDYRDDTVTFEFAALDFAAPHANTFQYWLEGVERRLGRTPAHAAR